MRSLLFLLFLMSSPVWAEGRFSVHWEAPTTAQGDAARKLLEGDPFYEVLTRVLNAAFILPRDVPIVFSQTGVPNAWYSPDKHQITVSYEMVGEVFATYNQPSDSLSALTKTRSTLAFILLHEVGHALIGELELPIVAREEDAADEFATIFSAMIAEEWGPRMAETAALWFGRNGEAGAALSKLAYWDEHSLNSQRYFDIMCDLYAANPKKFAAIKQHVPAERLQEAFYRYPEKVRTWNRLLAAHERGGSDHSLLTKLTPPPDAGRIVFRIPPKQGVLMEPDKLWRVGAYQRLIPALNRTFRLPRTITVSVAQTGSNQHINKLLLGEIILSQEATDETMDMLEKLSIPAEKRRQLLRSFEDFALMRQICRTLIYEYDIPTTGPIDDAAEDLAALIVVGQDDLRPILFDIAFFYEAQGVFRNERGQGDFWNASALELQKFFEVLSYLYIEDPKTYPYYPDLIPQKLRQRQLLRSRRDYLKKSRAWQVLLKPYMY